MQVGVDLERLRNLNSGLGQFCFHLAKGLVSASAKDVELQFYYPKNYTPKFQTPSSEISFADKLFGVRNKKLQLFHCTHQDSHLFPPKTPTVLTIHDLNFMEKYTGAKQTAKLKAMQARVNKAKGLVFISEYTKRLAAEHLSLPKVPQRVIYNGNCLDSNLPSEKPKNLPDGNFLFAIGIVNPKKNFLSLLPLLTDNDLRLVIAGNNTHPYASLIREEAAKMKISNRLVFTGAITDAEKYWLYDHCKAFVFPSLAEGFGLPVIEAMSLGKPVFLSRKGSLPEIGSSLAYYWDTFEPTHMIDVFNKGMIEYENHTEKKQELKNWAANFSWDKAAKDYLAFYKEVIEGLK